MILSLATYKRVRCLQIDDLHRCNSSLCLFPSMLFNVSNHLIRHSQPGRVSGINFLGFNLCPLPSCPLHQHLLNRQRNRAIILGQKICRGDVHIRCTSSGRVLSRPRMWLQKLDPLRTIRNIMEKQHEWIAGSHSSLLFLE